MQRYFVNNKENDLFILSNDDSHHVINVMRMNINDEVEIVFDNHLYLASITNLDMPVKCTLVKELDNNERMIPKIVIVQALVKEQKMDYILQKACELGVYQIIPVNTSRSVVKIDKNDTKKIIRWNKILKEASEQSKRIDIPILDKIYNFNDLKTLAFKEKYICSTKENKKLLKSTLSKYNINDTIVYVIGSEGGFDPKEENELIENGFIPISLGNNILRTETASLFIMSAVNYEFER